MTFGDLIDSSEEYFLEYVNKLDYGQTLSILSLITQAFSNLNDIRLSYLKFEDDLHTQMLKKVYAEMLRVEHKYFLLKEVVEKRESRMSKISENKG